MRKLFFILIGVISAGFALYFFACSTVDMFKMIVPRSASKIRSAKHVLIHPITPVPELEVMGIQ